MKLVLLYGTQQFSSWSEAQGIFKHTLKASSFSLYKKIHKAQIPCREKILSQTPLFVIWSYRIGHFTTKKSVKEIVFFDSPIYNMLFLSQLFVLYEQWYSIQSVNNYDQVVAHRGAGSKKKHLICVYIWCMCCLSGWILLDECLWNKMFLIKWVQVIDSVPDYLVSSQ